MNKIKLIAFIYLISPLSLAEEISLKTKDSTLHEHYSQEVPISGNVIAGIELYNEENQENSFSSTIHLPEKIQKKNNYLCFQLLSKDGTYTSRNTYLIPKTNGISSSKGKADFSPSKHLDLLNEKSNKNAIATKIHTGKCLATTEEKIYLPAIKTSSNTATATHLRIYIDSLGATDVKMAARNLIDKSKKSKVTNCKLATGTKLTGFDYTCSLSIDFELNGSIWELFIARFKYTRKLNTVKIRVVL